MRFCFDVDDLRNNRNPFRPELNTERTREMGLLMPAIGKIDLWHRVPNSKCRTSRISNSWNFSETAKGVMCITAFSKSDGVDERISIVWIETSNLLIIYYCKNGNPKSQVFVELKNHQINETANKMKFIERNWLKWFLFTPNALWRDASRRIGAVTLRIIWYASPDSESS